MKIQLIYIFILRIIRFALNRKHLLTILLRIEFVILVLFISIYIYILNFNYEFYFVLIFLTIRVCERAIGLSLIVAIIRSYGNDYFNSLNILW